MGMIKIRIKRFVLTILAILGYILLLPLWKNLKSNSIRVLRYHSISNDRGHEVNVKVEDFKKQMNYLAAKFNVLSLGELVDILINRKKIPPRTVMLSFDDGYKDNFLNAFAILKGLNLKATFFLVAGFVGTDKILPHDRSNLPQYNYLLNWDEARRMQEGGMNFGSHGLTHAKLTRLDWEELEKELNFSKKTIEENLKEKILAISYPYGLYSDFNEKILELVRGLGYTCGFTAMYGANTHRSDIYKLRRIGIEASDTLFSFKAKLNGALDLLCIKETTFLQNIVKFVNRILGA